MIKHVLIIPKQYRFCHDKYGIRGYVWAWLKGKHCSRYGTVDTRNTSIFLARGQGQVFESRPWLMLWNKKVLANVLSMIYNKITFS